MGSAVRFLAVISLWYSFNALAVLVGCGEGVKTHDPQARIVLSANTIQTTDPLWKKHLMMLDAMNLIPAEIELSFTPSAIQRGRYQTLNYFQQALNEVMVTPDANVSIRMLAHICQVIAVELGEPKVAGDLFLSYLNHLSMDVEGLMAGKPANDDEILRRIKQNSIMPFVPLSSMKQVPDNDFALKTTFSGINNISFYLRHQDTQSGFVSALATGLQTLGFSPAAGVPSVVEGSETKVTLQGRDRHYEFKWKSLRDNQVGSLVVVPAIGNTLTDFSIPWSRIAYWDGVELGGVFNIGRETAERLNRDIHVFERLMFPLLIRSGAYELMQFAIQVQQGAPSAAVPDSEAWQFYSIFRKNGKLPDDATEPQRYQAAIAQYLFSAVVLEPIAGADFYTSNLHLLLHQAPRGLTFADMELASRAFKLPVEYIACPDEHPGWSRWWPWKPAGTPPPNYSAFIVTANPDETKQRKAHWGLNNAKNLKLLRTDTGVFTND